MAMAVDFRPGARPVLVAFAGPSSQRRWTVLLRLILVIPQVVVLYLLGVAAGVLAMIGWFGALFTGRLPRFVGDFLTGYIRWMARVYSYLFLLTDVYPPFTLEDADHPVRVAVDPAGPLNRLAVFCRLFLAIPAYLLGGLASFGASTIVLFIAWLIVLVFGRMPRSMFEAYSAVVRYMIRLYGYYYLLTAEYPSGLFGDSSVGASFGVAPPYGPSPLGWPSAPGGYVPPAAPYQPGAPGDQMAVAPPPSPAGAPGTGTVIPGAFTYGGTTHLWGYSADRHFCGIWLRATPSAALYVWRIEEQEVAWARFWDLEPAAEEYHGPQPTYPPAQPTYPAQGTAPPAPWSPTGGPAGGALAGGPAYGSPAGFGPAGFGAPAFGTPGGFGPPGYGPPAYGSSAMPTSVPPVDPGRWRMVLSSGAKALIVIFIALGVGSYAVYIPFVLGRTGTIMQRGLSGLMLQNDYLALSSQLHVDESEAASCHQITNPLPCITSADRQVAQDFATFVQQVDRASVPAGAAPAAVQLSSDSTQAKQIFDQLALSGSLAQYQQTVLTSGLQQVLNRFDTDYGILQQALAGG